MQVNKTEAAPLLMSLGLKNVDKWDDAKFVKWLTLIPGQMNDPTSSTAKGAALIGTNPKNPLTDDEATAQKALLNSIVTAVESGDTITVTGDGATTAPNGKKGKGKPAAKQNGKANKGKADATAHVNGKPGRPKGSSGAGKGGMGQLEACYRVLKAKGSPMSVTEMCEASLKKGLWQSPGGKSPDRTLYTSILREIQKKGDKARFVKVERGRFEAVEVAE